MIRQKKHLHHQENSIRFCSFKMLVIGSLGFLFITMSVGCLRVQAVPQSIGSQISNSISVSPDFQSEAMHYPMPTQLPTQNKSLDVFFSKSNASGNVFGATLSVKRVMPVIGHTTSIAAIASYAIQQLIAGPTSIERQAGYTSMLQQSLFGKSNCAGQQNFIFTLDKKGMLTKPGVATIRFCRLISSAGVGVDAAIRSEVESTLKQFPEIKAVVILSSNGHCFGDESGVNFCLR
jgi:hypothetical protein